MIGGLQLIAVLVTIAHVVLELWTGCHYATSTFRRIPFLGDAVNIHRYCGQADVHQCGKVRETLGIVLNLRLNRGIGRDRVSHRGSESPLRRECQPSLCSSHRVSDHDSLWVYPPLLCSLHPTLLFFWQLLSHHLALFPVKRKNSAISVSS